MLHPDSFFDQHQEKHQDRLREAETWRLVKLARQQRAHYFGRLLRRLIVATRRRLKRQACSKPVQPDLANLPE